MRSVALKWLKMLTDTQHSPLLNKLAWNCSQLHVTSHQNIISFAVVLYLCFLYLFMLFITSIYSADPIPSQPVRYENNVAVLSSQMACLLQSPSQLYICKTPPGPPCVQDANAPFLHLSCDHVETVSMSMPGSLSANVSVNVPAECQFRFPQHEVLLWYNCSADACFKSYTLAAHPTNIPFIHLDSS